jgi:transposase-like protein
MKRKRHSPAEIVAKLAHADALGKSGRLQSEIARELGISVMTLHRWRKQMHSTAAPALAPIEFEARRAPENPGRIAELQLENSRLRRLVTDLLLDKVRLEEAADANAA